MHEDYSGNLIKTQFVFISYTYKLFNLIFFFFFYLINFKQRQNSLSRKCTFAKRLYFLFPLKTSILKRENNSFRINIYHL